jgi:hypothetical protein
MGDLQGSVQGIGCRIIWCFSDDIADGVLGRTDSFHLGGLSFVYYLGMRVTRLDKCISRHNIRELVGQMAAGLGFGTQCKRITYGCNDEMLPCIVTPQGLGATAA